MTDREIAESIKEMFYYSNGRQVFETCAMTIDANGVVHLVAPEQATQYYLKKNKALLVDIPPLDIDRETALCQIAIAVGRRLERFERGRKANATRTPNSRKEIAQNAIQARWNAK